jgi:hypothetical protein
MLHFCFVLLVVAGGIALLKDFTLWSANVHADANVRRLDALNHRESWSRINEYQTYSNYRTEEELDKISLDTQAALEEALGLAHVSTAQSETDK